jgi:hypothetical protein
MMIREWRDSSDATYLSSTAITDKHKLEGGNLLCGSVGHCCGCVKNAVRFLSDAVM